MVIGRGNAEHVYMAEKSRADSLAYGSKKGGANCARVFNRCFVARATRRIINHRLCGMGCVAFVVRDREM